MSARDGLEEIRQHEIVAFLAAADDSFVTQKHLELAVRREHQKMGKWLVREEAG